MGAVLNWRISGETKVADEVAGRGISCLTCWLGIGFCGRIPTRPRLGRLKVRDSLSSSLNKSRRFMSKRGWGFREL